MSIFAMLFLAITAALCIALAAVLVGAFVHSVYIAIRDRIARRRMEISNARHLEKSRLRHAAFMGRVARGEVSYDTPSDLASIAF